MPDPDPGSTTVPYDEGPVVTIDAQVVAVLR